MYSSTSVLRIRLPFQNAVFAVLLQNSKLYFKVRFKMTYAAISLHVFQILKHEKSNYGIGLLKPSERRWFYL
jgi:hypothetical protein